MFEVALAVLMIMTASASRAVSGSRPAAWCLLVTVIVWPFVNRQIEGPVLLVVARGHGLAATDLLSVAGVMLSAWILIGRKYLGSRSTSRGLRVQE